MSAVMSVVDRVVRPPVRRARTVGRRRVRTGAVIAYHSIAERPIDPWGLAIAPGHFDAHLAVLAELGTIVPTGVLADRSPTERWQRRHEFAITFDDGYVDNLVTAVPILERRDAPATVFVPTGFVGSPGFWWEDLAWCSIDPAADVDALADTAVSLGLVSGVESLSTASADERHRLLYDALVERERSQIDGFVAELVAASGVEAPGVANSVRPRPVTLEELHDLARHPLITVGVHTVDHPRLTTLDPSSVRTQITECADRLAEVIGHRPGQFAYPYGFFDDAAVSIVDELGFDAAFTMHGDWVRLRPHRHRLPRRQPPDVDGRAFRTWLGGS
jgi:peptidoglycan/xylan/chitin deacetylase (PgdA/CDA1 family)